jgi:peptidylprolyl isomerase
MASVLEASTQADWREPDPTRTLYMQLDHGTVVFELAPRFAPNTVANILSLVSGRYFDGLSINRSQENYVVQWGDAAAGTDESRQFDIAATLEAEFFRAAAGLDVVALDSNDAYADQVGFVDGFPMGSDGSRSWLTHCYAMLGIGRDVDPNSGNGTELYVVTGHAPRHLDRNVTLVGRVIHGIGQLTTLPRGTGALGFYETAEERVPIRAMRVASDIPESQRLPLEIFRTDTEAFQQLVEARKFRLEEWFADPAGRIGICNVPIPVRMKNSAPN